MHWHGKKDWLFFNLFTCPLRFSDPPKALHQTRICNWFRLLYLFSVLPFRKKLFSNFWLVLLFPFLGILVKSLHFYILKCVWSTSKPKRISKRGSVLKVCKGRLLQLQIQALQVTECDYKNSSSKFITAKPFQYDIHKNALKNEYNWDYYPE